MEIKEQELNLSRDGTLNSRVRVLHMKLTNLMLKNKGGGEIRAFRLFISYHGNPTHCFQKNGDSSGETNMK